MHINLLASGLLWQCASPTVSFSVILCKRNCLRTCFLAAGCLPLLLGSTAFHSVNHLVGSLRTPTIQWQKPGDVPENAEEIRSSVQEREWLPMPNANECLTRTAPESARDWVIYSPSGLDKLISLFSFRALECWYPATEWSNIYIEGV